MFKRKQKSDTDTVDAKDLSADQLEVINLVNEVSEFVYNVIEEIEPQRAFFLAVQASEFTERAHNLIIKMGATHAK